MADLFKEMMEDDSLDYDRRGNSWYYLRILRKMDEMLATIRRAEDKMDVLMLQLSHATGQPIETPDPSKDRYKYPGKIEWT